MKPFKNTNSGYSVEFQIERVKRKVLGIRGAWGDWRGKGGIRIKEGEGWGGGGEKRGMKFNTLIVLFSYSNTLLIFIKGRNFHLPVNY